MTDSLAILKEHVHKAEAKVSRYSKSLEAAKKELADLQTTLRVMAEISGEPKSVGHVAASVNPSSRQQEIADILGVGRQNGKSPQNLFDIFTRASNDDVNIDTFRTTIWRMKGRTYKCDGQDFLVMSVNGEYWKQPASPDDAGEVDTSMF